MNTALPMRSIAAAALALTWALVGVAGFSGAAEASDVYCRTVNKSLQCSDVPMEGAVLVRRSGQSRSPGDGAQATSSTAAVSSPGFSPPVSAAAARLQEEDTARAVREVKAGRVEFKIDKAANIHVPVGKASFSAKNLEENARAVIEAVSKSRPASAKGVFMRSCTLSLTMSPPVSIDLKEFTA